MTVRDLLNILFARHRVILGVWLAIVLVTLAICLVMPAKFKSTTAVVVDVKSPDPIAGVMMQGMTAPAYMATQVDIINSPRVARRVVSLLKLDESPDVRAAWMDATDGKGSLGDWYARVLQRALEVRPSRESNVIEISYYSKQPEFAAAVANAFARAYIDTNIELRVDPAKSYASWFEQQSRGMRDHLEQARKRLSAYQQDKGIVVFSDERLNYENAKLAELQSQLVLAETQLAESSSKQKSTSKDTLADVMQNPVVGQLKGELARAEAKLQELSRNLGVNHPQYQGQLSQIDALKRQVGIEIGRVNSGFATSAQVSREKASELRGAIDAHKQNILKLMADRDEVAVLQQEVDAAQRAFDAINQRQLQSSLESESNQTNVSILTDAVAPLKKATPRTLLSLVVASFLGLLIGCCVALLLEFRNRRIYDADDILRMVGIPVLSIIPGGGERIATALALQSVQSYPKLLGNIKGGR
ncbi:MAG TPA: chain length determinant protein EpsF [Rhodocyclaceae bacterium]|nr:chain length determinant protein EpsF [Rhodocyclaceae bacterium]